VIITHTVTFTGTMQFCGLAIHQKKCSINKIPRVSNDERITSHTVTYWKIRNVRGCVKFTFYTRTVAQNESTKRTLEITSDAPTNTGTHVTSNAACALASDTKTIQSFDWSK